MNGSAPDASSTPVRTARANVMAVRRRAADSQAARVVFALAVVFGVLQAAPVVAEVNDVFGSVYLPMALLWLGTILATRLGTWRSMRRAGVVSACMLILGALGLMEAEVTGEFYAYLGTVVGPIALFFGIQQLDKNELQYVRRAARQVLLGAAVLQVLYYAMFAGFEIFSPTLVLQRHSDAVWWADVGARVLANPNNASVVYCTAFGWAVAEAALGQRRRSWWVFAVASGLAIWVTGSRGAMLTALVLALVGVVVRFRSVWLGRAVFAALALVVASISALTIWAPAVPGSLADSIGARGDARLAALQVVMTRPFGTGAGTVAETLDRALAPIFTTGETGATSHDFFINWSVALGLLGLAPLIYALWTAFSRSDRASRWISMAPLLGFLLAGEAAGIDVLTRGNSAWAITLWVLIGLGWRGGVVNAVPVEGAQGITGGVDVQARVLLLGFTVPDKLLRSTAAADRNMPTQTHAFAWALVEALRAGGAQVELLSSLPITNYPGNPRVFVGTSRFVERDVTGTTLPFINVLGLKHLTRFASCLFMGPKRLPKGSTLLIHGVHSPYLLYGAVLRLVAQTRVIVVVTDPPGVILPGDGWMTRAAKPIDAAVIRWLLHRMNGMVALNEDIARRFAVGLPSMVMEGIVAPVTDLGRVDNRAPEPPAGGFELIYAGGLTESYGVQALVAAVESLPTPAVRLRVFGKGHLEDWITARAGQDSRILAPEFVDRADVLVAYRRGDLLVQPRPVKGTLARYSFPSKLLEYLASGTPVLSTRLSGIPEDYEPYLYWIDDDSAAGIARAIREVMSLPDAERRARGDRAAEFVHETRGVTVQGRRLVRFLAGDLPS